MRFFAPLLTGLLAIGVVAQQNLNDNAILIPQGQATLDVKAGQPLTIEWTNPSDGTVTIKLQQQPVTPDGGIILASNIPASDLKATLQIPAAGDVNSFQYTIQIIDDTDPTNYNFSPNFGIQGATGTATGFGTATATTGTASQSTGTATITSTETETTDTASATSTDDNTSSGTSASSTDRTVTSTRTSSASASAQTTTAPTSAPNAAGSLKVQGSFLALAGALMAIM